MNNTGKGLIAYLLGWVGALIILFGLKDNDRNITFHCYQSLMINISLVVVSIAFGIVGAIVPFIGILTPAFGIFCFVLVILGVIKVCNNEPDPKLILVGDLTEKLFGDAINKAPVTVAPTGQTPNFDPNTGQPINNPPQANFDPNTGQPINKPEEPKEEEAASEDQKTE